MDKVLVSYTFAMLILRRLEAERLRLRSAVCEGGRGAKLSSRIVEERRATVKPARIPNKSLVHISNIVKFTKFGWAGDFEFDP